MTAFKLIFYRYFMASFTPKQQRAIQEKVDLFREIAERGFSCDREHSVRTAIYRKRQGWLEENFEQVSRNLQDYPSAVEKAFRLVFLEYMKINPDDVGTEFLPSRRVRRLFTYGQEIFVLTW